jgi:hypothetical protein
MSVDTTPEQRGDQEPSEAAVAPRLSLIERARASLAQVDYRTTLLAALVTAVAWCGLFLANNILQVLAGVVPVMAGLYLGRRVQKEHLAHGLVLGFASFGIGMVIVLIYAGLLGAGLVPAPMLALKANQPPAPGTPGDLLLSYFTLSIFALIPFPAFGTVMAGRAEQRNSQLRKQTEERGGRLERPGVIRTLDDLRGLSLPQLGSFVSALYRKKGFELKDYRFIDKDKHLDLELTYAGGSYLARLSVADKVRPGTVESLLQEMRRRSIPRGLVITSTEFTPEAAKSAGNRRGILAIDGQTLFDMSES